MSSAAVEGRCEVLFDSGIRSGADALKALALGARAVLLGRPYIWGLALGGEQGVVDVLRSFLADLDLAMALSGYANIDEVDADALVARENKWISPSTSASAPSARSCAAGWRPTRLPPNRRRAGKTRTTHGGATGSGGCMTRAGRRRAGPRSTVGAGRA